LYSFIENELLILRCDDRIAAVREASAV